MLKKPVEKGQPPHFVGADLVIFVELPGIEPAVHSPDLRIHDLATTSQTYGNLGKPGAPLKISTASVI